MTDLVRGDVWLAAWGAGPPGEPGKHCPGVIVSIDALNVDEPDQLVVLVPLSASRRPSELRPRVRAFSGVDRPSVAVPRGVRGLARSRLLERLGSISADTLGEIEMILAFVLGIDR